MLILNHRDGLHHIGDASGKGKDLTLMPGLNDVSEAAWLKAIELPAFAAYVEDGTMEVVQTKAGKSVNASDFPSLPEKQAIALVGETVDKKLLKAWLAAEKREAVQAVLEARIEEVTPGK